MPQYRDVSVAGDTAALIAANLTNISCWAPSCPEPRTHKHPATPLPKPRLFGWTHTTPKSTLPDIYYSQEKRDAAHSTTPTRVHVYVWRSHFDKSVGVIQQLQLHMHAALPRASGKQSYCCLGATVIDTLLHPSPPQTAPLTASSAFS